MKSFQEKFKFGLISGIGKGWSGFVWMLKILIPISFFTVLLDYSGYLDYADFLLKPLMSLMGLPSVAALPLIVGMLTGIYGAIASMAMLPLSGDHMTLIAVFLLISHSLVQEGIIQGKSGMNPLKATVFRLVTSFAVVMLIARILSPDTAAVISDHAVSPGAVPFTLMLRNWCAEMLSLSVQIFVIIMALMILLNMMKSFDIIKYIVSGLTPVLRMMGLNERVGILWLTAALFGISFGAAVIVEEAKEGNLTDEELTRLHLSIGINHAMIDDPAFFLPLGIHPFWLWIPRIVAAIIAVQLFNLWQEIKRLRVKVLSVRG